MGCVVDQRRILGLGLGAVGAFVCRRVLFPTSHPLSIYVYAMRTHYTPRSGPTRYAAEFPCGCVGERGRGCLCLGLCQSACCLRSVHWRVKRCIPCFVSFGRPVCCISGQKGVFSNHCYPVFNSWVGTRTVGVGQTPCPKCGRKTARHAPPAPLAPHAPHAL